MGAKAILEWGDRRSPLRNWEARKPSLLRFFDRENVLWLVRFDWFHLFMQKEFL